MSNLKISVPELVTNLGLEDKCFIKGEQKEFILSYEDLDNIINAVGQRISASYSESHRSHSGDEDDLMLGGIIDELNEAFSSSSNGNKPKTKM